ncbi:hypothetical protein [Idiomarina seosinensis]|nr:hypothetical protein [Idiomarina seosinensis]
MRSSKKTEYSVHPAKKAGMAKLVEAYKKAQAENKVKTMQV